MKNINLIYQVPISESAIVEGDFIIQGTAINETVTSNNHKFIAEELSKSANTLTGCPLLVDHENKVENIKGRVLRGSWNESDKRVDFKAKVMDEMCKQMIKDGRLNSVSVGAMVEDVDEDATGALIPRNITFKELSLVAVPADSGATFSIAMKEAYEAKKSLQVNPENATNVVKDVQGSVANEVLKGGLKQMSEENITDTPAEEVKSEVKSEEVKSEESQEKQEEVKAETPEPAVDEVKVDETAELKAKIEAMEKLTKELIEKSQAKKVEEKPVLKNEFEESDAEVKEGYKIVQGAGYFSFVADKY